MFDIFCVIYCDFLPDNLNKTLGLLTKNTLLRLFKYLLWILEIFRRKGVCLQKMQICHETQEVAARAPALLKIFLYLLSTH